MEDDHSKDTIKREELYRLIWKRPATEIAKDYDISSSMLTRIGRELDVPKPKVGHWAKVAHGKKIRKPPLPAPKHGAKIEWKIDRTIADEQKAIAKARKEVPGDPVSPEIQNLLEAERIRSYADIAESRILREYGADSIASDSDAGLWLAWIRMRADEIDPLSVERKPWMKVAREIIRLDVN